MYPGSNINSSSLSPLKGFMAIIQNKSLKLLRALHGAKYIFLFLHKTQTNQRLATLGATEARVRSVKIVPFVFDSLRIRGDRSAARLADLGVKLVIAFQAVWMVIMCHVHVARQTLVTFKTAEMFHVPVSIFSLRVLPAEYKLLTTTMK